MMMNFIDDPKMQYLIARMSERSAPVPAAALLSQPA